jgi:hypothetical protein
MSNQTLSICIPTYNRFINLEETLQNISNASKDCSFLKEILIMDNNESSKAKDIIERYMPYNDKIKYVQNEKNIGAENNFKKCIDVASGEYIWMIADDDLLFDYSLDLIMEQKFDFDILLVNWSLYSKDFLSLIKKNVLPKYKKKPDDKNDILSHFSSRLSFISSVMFKKSLFNKKVRNIYDSLIPYQLSFLALAYSIIDDSPKISFLERPLIMQRSDNDPYLADNTTFFYNVFSDGIYFFHEEISKLGYSNSAIRDSLKSSFYIFIWKDLINRKIKKNNYKFAFSNSYKNYSHIFSLKIILLLIYIAPINLFLFLKTIKKFLK